EGKKISQALSGPRPSMSPVNIWVSPKKSRPEDISIKTGFCRIFSCQKHCLGGASTVEAVSLMFYSWPRQVLPDFEAKTKR
ncbi:hypothetical protein EVAR_10797_1, partial [Eumeta japonica]